MAIEQIAHGLRFRERLVRLGPDAMRASDQALKDLQAMGDEQPANDPAWFVASFYPAVRSALAAPLYVVEPDIWTAVAGSKSSPVISDGWEFHPSDLITDTGLLVLPFPVEMTDQETTGNPAVRMLAFSWAHAHDHDGVHRGAVVLTGWTEECFGGLLPAQYFLRSGHSTWHWLQARNDDEPPLDDAFSRFALTTLRFIVQRIALVDREQPDRASRRRAERDQAPITTVNVVHLRRVAVPPPTDPHEAVGFRYSHRFPVHGFWRQQWYPSQQRHAPKYIDTYIKGPKDAPLIWKERRFDVDR